MFRFSAVNLGCSKNMVDLEFAIGEILKFSDRTEIEFYDTPEMEEVEYVLVNTCGFLSSAREESEATLRNFDEMGKKVILMGCYVPVKDDAFLGSLKNLHAVLPFVDYSAIEGLLFPGKDKVTINFAALGKLKKEIPQLREERLKEYLDRVGRAANTDKAFIWKGDEIRAYIHAPFGYEYVKIAEGCDNNCTFCIIPKIRGKQKSRPIESVLDEVRSMVDGGISEVEIIAQDTTRYGTDFAGESKLIDLLEAMDTLPGDFKIRLFYLYPDILTLSHLERLAKLKRLIPYFDIPFQHWNQDVLKRMGRHYDQKHILSLLEFIRSKFPGSFIRTAFIVGFPGETPEAFDELLEFVRTQRFESVGVFEYHDEPLAASSKLDNKVSHEAIHERIHELDEVLTAIYDEQHAEAEGKEFDGFVMEQQGNSYVVRREIQAPEIDDYDQILRSHIKSKNRKPEVGEKIRYVL